jgi:UDPglucose 6-dehydrogenase
MKSSDKKICCIGAGYVGGPTMAMIASRCNEFEITVVDTNAERVAAWNSPELPVYEPGLDELVSKCRGKNLFFSTDIKRSIKESDIIFVSVNTPTKSYGEGSGKAADLRYIELCARQIAEFAESDKIVVEKSTPLKRVLNANGRGHKFEIVSNPEFMAEGTAIQDLEKPDRVLIGGDSTETGRYAVEKILQIYSKWVPRDRILTTNLWSSELSKLVANAFLAQRVSSINSISALCEATGADIDEISRAIGMDSRIGPKFLKASIGFGGSCFQKDILNLVYLCEHFGLPQVGQYWAEVVELNDWQKQRFVRRIIKTMFNSVAGKKIAVFGFSFKCGTNDTRESPAIYVCRALIEEKAQIIVHDPKVDAEEIKRKVAEALQITHSDIETSLKVVKDPYEAIVDAHALAILTEWDEYRQLDYKYIHSQMLKPAFLFDGRNILSSAEMAKVGFEFYPLGKAAQTQW